MIKGPLDRYGVIGHPVEHSKSPLIHAMFAAQTGHALTYEKVLAPRDGFRSSVASFVAENGRGLNVTVPFKLEAFDLAAERSERAVRAGAVNTLRFDPGGILGDNTDGVGLIRDLTRLGRLFDFELAGARILILGAGGAVRGILEPLRAAKPQALVVANRDSAKAEALVTAVASSDSVIRSAILEHLQDDRFDLILHATSAGFGGDVPRVPESLLAKARLVYDLAYGEGADPISTPFLRTAQSYGAAILSDGLGMLVEQAAESFAVWRGVHPEVGPVLEALRRTSSSAQ